jgi:hypothetical protein
MVLKSEVDAVRAESPGLLSKEKDAANAPQNRATSADSHIRVLNLECVDL